MNSIQICHIVAISQNRAIGKNNALPWHIPADLQHFKRLTQQGIVIMGRKTFESMGSKALPNRDNLVITTDKQYPQYPNIQLFTSLEMALQHGKQLAKQKNLSHIWIIGGERMFTETLAIANRLEITQVDIEIDQADSFYPQLNHNFQLISQSDWQMDDKSGLRYRFETYHNLPQNTM